MVVVRRVAQTLSDKVGVRIPHVFRSTSGVDLNQMRFSSIACQIRVSVGDIEIVRIRSAGLSAPLANSLAHLSAA